MDQDRPGAKHRRVPSSTAKRILQTAAELDAAGDELIDLQELRMAAQDAGISAESFDESVARHREASTPRPQELAALGRPPSYLSVAGSGALGAVAAVTLTSLFFGSPPEAALVGALVAGIGSISAVLAHFSVALRRGSSLTGAGPAGDSPRRWAVGPSPTVEARD